MANDGKMEHLSEEQIALYVDALELDRVSELPQMILDHVQDCFTCKEDIMEVASLVPPETWKRKRPHPYFDRLDRSQRRPENRASILKVVAIAIVAAGIGILAMIVVNHRPGVIVRRPGSLQTDSTGGLSSRRESEARTGGSNSAETTQESDPFAPSPDMENLVTMVLRAPDPCRVVSPANGSTVRSGKIRFAWSGASRRQSFHIMNNKEEELFKAAPPGTAYFFTSNLKPGLYYWKLIQDGELALTGKFYVR